MKSSRLESLDRATGSAHHGRKDRAHQAQELFLDLSAAVLFILAFAFVMIVAWG